MLVTRHPDRHGAQLAVARVDRYQRAGRVVPCGQVLSECLFGE
jgi:hypothetical protein